MWFASFPVSGSSRSIPASTNITITMSGAFFTSPPGTATNADTRLAGIASCGVLLLTAGATSVASDVAFGTT
ncbi:hypothetical protein BOC56_14805 [Burkholderia pseudomallei]|nr:hypothetical protein BOC56_14805 [Burkholderia pseudomallei]